MRKKLPATVVVLALVLASWFVATDRSPVYKGKRLAAYLKGAEGDLRLRYTWTWWAQGEPSERDRPEAECVFRDGRALEAVRKVGAKAMPLLVRMLEPEPPLHRRIRRLAESYPRVGKYFRMRSPAYYSMRQITAVAAFQQLGPRAIAVAPMLVPALADPDEALFALVALMAIRPGREQDILALTNCFQVQNGSANRLHGLALLTLSTYGNQASNAVAFLLGALNKTNDCWVRGCAAVALARVGAPPELAVPPILDQLKTQPSVLPSRRAPRCMPGFDDDEALQMTLWALGQFGKNAVIALEPLSKLQSHPDGFVGEVARIAIGKIEANHQTRHPE